MAKKAARRGARKKTASRKKTTRKKASRGRKKTTGLDLIISKSRTKAAAGINVSSEFYAALDESVRTLISGAEERALSNNRRTLRAHDL